jgi:hypothetical protein
MFVGLLDIPAAASSSIRGRAFPAAAAEASGQVVVFWCSCEPHIPKGQESASIKNHRVGVAVGGFALDPSPRAGFPFTYSLQPLSPVTLSWNGCSFSSIQ